MKIISILPNNQVIVDATGLYRVLIQPENDVLDEFAEERRVKSLVEEWNQCHPGSCAVAIPYSSTSTGGAA